MYFIFQMDPVVTYHHFMEYRLMWSGCWHVVVWGHLHHVRGHHMFAHVGGVTCRGNLCKQIHCLKNVIPLPLTTQADISRGLPEVKVLAAHHTRKAHLVHLSPHQVPPWAIVTNIELAEASLRVIIVCIATPHHVGVSPPKL